MTTMGMLLYKAEHLSDKLKIDVVIRHQHNGYYACTNRHGDSPVGTKESVWHWLDAFECGFRAGYKARQRIEKGEFE